METTPMTFNEYFDHPLRLEWRNNRNLPTNYLPPSFHQYLKLEHNITIIDSECDFDSGNEMVMVKFKSEQDYILWQLHQ